MDAIAGHESRRVREAGADEVSRLQRFCEWIGRRRYSAGPILLGLLVAAPSLIVGIQADDLFIRNVIRGSGPFSDMSQSSWQPYMYMDGDPVRNQVLIDHGWMPWWMDLHCSAALSRPLTAITFMWDYYAWPDYPVLMHVQSMMWYGLTIWAVAILYRRIIGQSLPFWVAVLATVLYAVDDAHGIPAGWLANRNAPIAAFFGVLTLIAHDRWRHDEWRAGICLAPLAFLAALLAKEEAVATGGYLLAYALFLDRGRWPRRLATLAPCLLAGLGWYVGYKWLGYGVFASEVYVDPANDPLRFAGRVAHSGPLLLLGLWGLPPSDLSLIWSPAILRLHWFWAIGILALIGLMIRPLVAREPIARFWLIGMVLSVIPICAVFPSDRLLMFPGLGAMGLLAQWLTGRSRHANWVPTARWWRRMARVCGFALIGIHLIFSPLHFMFVSVVMKFALQPLNNMHDTIPDDRAFAEQTAVFANSPACITDLLWIQTRWEDGRAVPRRTLNLSPSGSASSITRFDERTLVVRPLGGYLQPRGLYPDGEAPPPLSFRYQAQLMDMVVRSHARPMHLHETINLSAVTIEITELTDDGRPAEATFRFRAPLEDPSFRWLYIEDARYVPFVVPDIGETVEVPSPLR